MEWCVWVLILVYKQREVDCGVVDGEALCSEIVSVCGGMSTLTVKHGLYLEWMNEWMMVTLWESLRAGWGRRYKGKAPVKWMEKCIEIYFRHHCIGKATFFSFCILFTAILFFCLLAILHSYKQVFPFYILWVWILWYSHLCFLQWRRLKCVKCLIVMQIL